MSFTNLVLGQNWGFEEWPDHVEVGHTGKLDCKRYVPERTCRIVYDEREYAYRCSRCGCYTGTFHHSDGKFYEPEYCASCGTKVVAE